MTIELSLPPVPTSARLNQVCYEIRGDLARRGAEREAQGRSVLKLNIGNPGLFGFSVSAAVRDAVREHMTDSEAYCDQKGLAPARAAIADQLRARGARGADAERIFIGNGVSELIDMALRALLDVGDEVLLPSPDYPLWSAATVLNGGAPVYYPCLASNQHLPDVAAIEALITPRTRALVLINPNNPTGAVYSSTLLQALVELAARHRLVLLSDEIYDEIVYDGAHFIPVSSLSGEVPCLTFGGLSKMQRACGYRVGWAALTGAASRIGAIENGMELLASLRLCANVPGQWAIVPALTGADTLSEMVTPGGRLHATRAAVIDACASSRFLDLVVPHGAMYAFPSVRASELADFDDEVFALNLLEEEDVLVVPGSGFNFAARNHFRITLLPQADTMQDVFVRIERTLQRMANASAGQRHVA